MYVRSTRVGWISHVHTAIILQILLTMACLKLDIFPDSTVLQLRASDLYNKQGEQSSDIVNAQHSWRAEVVHVLSEVVKFR